MRYIIFLCVFLSVLSPQARADVVNEFIRLDCNQDLNYLRISTFQVNGDIPQKYSQNSPKELWDNYYIIAINNLLEINERERWQEKKSEDFNCNLRNANGDISNYITILKGYAENYNPNGQCGLHLSFALFVTRNEEKLIEDFNFARHCRDYTSIDSLAIIPHEQYIQIKGNDADEKVFDKTIWFDGDYRDALPIKDEVVYAE